MAKKLYVPVYLPDRTEIGIAEIDVVTGSTLITIENDTTLTSMIQANVIGLSMVFLDKDAAETIIDAEASDDEDNEDENEDNKENTDG